MKMIQSNSVSYRVNIIMGIMKLYLIFTLCLSLGIGDKLDRAYLPPEGSFQSSGVDGDLKLPYDYYVNNNKEMEIELQNSKIADPTETDSLLEQKLHNENINSDRLQNIRYFGDNASKEKQVFVKLNGQNIFPMYPFAVTDTSLSSIVDDNNDNYKPGHLNPYLPLKMQGYQSSMARFKINKDSDKLDSFDANNKDNIVGTDQPPNNFQNLKARYNMPDEDVQSKLLKYPSENDERKLDIKNYRNEITSNDNEKIPQENNVSIYDSKILIKDENNRKITAGLHIGSYNKDRNSRPKAENDKKAEILSYESFISPEDGKFAFSFNTSNEIHVEEHGTSNNGVKAEGGYSYTGDDGKVYTVRYTADENGFQPTGDHLPTPPPIPEAILRVIELAMKNKENNVSEDNGMYDDKKYGYQNYNRGFMEKYKKPHSKLPSKLAKTKSNPESRQKAGTITQLNSFGNKISNNGVIDTNIPINISNNFNYRLLNNKNNFFSNGDQESNKQSHTDYVPQRPSVAKSDIHQQPDQSNIDSFMEDQINRRPFTENLKITGNKQYEKPEETISYFPTKNLMIYMKPKPANKIQPEFSFVNGDNVNKEQGNFETRPNDTSSSTQKPFDTDSSIKENYENNRYNNIPEINENSTMINPNTEIYVNNPRETVIKFKYDTEPMAGYHYLAPITTFMMNPDIPHLITNSRQDVDLSIPKPKQGHMSHAVEIERPINKENNRSDMEKFVNLAIIGPGAFKRPSTKEYIIPKFFENEKKTEYSQSFVEAAPGKANSKDSNKPHKEANMYRGDINADQSHKAVGNPKTAKGDVFSGPKQKPYFDSVSGYHY